MTHHITADHLVDAATKAVMEELFREFDKALQSLCNEEQDRIVVFRTLRYTRIRLHVLQKYLPDDEAATRNTQSRFFEIALGYINTELDLLCRYGNKQEAIALKTLRLLRGLPGYLILFDTHAFVLQRQLNAGMLPSQSEF